MNIKSINDTSFGMANVSKPIRVAINLAKTATKDNPLAKKQLSRDIVVIENIMPNANLHLKEIWPQNPPDLMLAIAGSMFGLPNRALSVMVNGKSKAIISGIADEGISPVETVRLLAKALVNIDAREKMQRGVELFSRDSEFFKKLSGKIQTPTRHMKKVTGDSVPKPVWIS